MTLLLASSSRLRLDEGKQVRIELVRMDDRHAMWKTGVDLELSVLDQLGRKSSSVRKRHDLVIVPVHDEGGNVEGSSDRCKGRKGALDRQVVEIGRRRLDSDGDFHGTT